MEHALVDNLTWQAIASHPLGPTRNGSLLADHKDDLRCFETVDYVEKEEHVAYIRLSHHLLRFSVANPNPSP